MNQIIRIFLVFVLLLLLSIDTAYCYEFTVEGNIKYQIFSSGGQVLVEQENSFTFSVKDCNWFIKSVPKRFLKFGKEQPLMAYEIASSDSTNFYELESIEGLPKSVKSGNQTFAGRIGPGAVPFGLSDPRLVVLWYAFGSGCYFANLHDDYVNPPTAFRGEDTYAKDFRVQATWQLQTNPPFLPKSIAFYGVPKYQTNEVPDLPFTKCIYLVQDFKEESSFVIPRTILVQYFLKNPTNKTAILTAANMQIEITNVQEKVSSKSFRPDISGIAFLSDMRTISPNTPFGIVVPQGHDWPNLDASKQKAAAIALAMAQRPSVSESHNLRIAVIRIVWIASIFIPLAVMGYLQWKKQTTKHKNENEKQN